MKYFFLASLLIMLFMLTVGQNAPDADVSKFYQQDGTDPAWEQVKASGDLVIGKNSTHGVSGSKITVNHELLDVGPTANNPFPRNIAIHTLGNSHILRKDFDKWSRWYQEDGNVQIFRLFKGETNVRNDRENAARIEAYCLDHWTHAEGKWHEWTGTFTIIKPLGACILQNKNNKNDWGAMINMGNDGGVRMNRRRGVDVDLAKNMVGKPFTIRELDNGRDYHIFFNGKYIGGGTWDRPEGTSSFRWGMYVGNTVPRQDGMLLVTGATIRTLDALPPECTSDPSKNGK